MNSVKVICITPIKNEDWILENFLKATSLWADYIIIADQNSTDKSIEIAKLFPKVKVIPNESREFNEPERQKLLLNEARKIPGKKVIIALDADEFLTPDWEEEIENIKKLPEGTVLQFLWRNIHPNLKKYWTPSAWMKFGYVDDGIEHIGKTIHSPRIPSNEFSTNYKCKTISVMHLQYIDWNRMTSKHRWYQCFERIKFPTKHPIEIFRMYHHMYSIPLSDFLEIPNQWVSNYEKKGINIFQYKKKNYYWWDEEIIKFLERYSPKYFKFLPIWDVDWNKIAESIGIKCRIDLSDPRTIEIKKLHTWLYETQPFVNERKVRELDIEYMKKYFTW